MEYMRAGEWRVDGGAWQVSVGQVSVGWDRWAKTLGGRLAKILTKILVIQPPQGLQQSDNERVKSWSLYTVADEVDGCQVWMVIQVKRCCTHSTHTNTKTDRKKWEEGNTGELWELWFLTTPSLDHLSQNVSRSCRAISWNINLLKSSLTICSFSTKEIGNNFHPFSPSQGCNIW